MKGTSQAKKRVCCFAVAFVFVPAAADAQDSVRYPAVSSVLRIGKPLVAIGDEQQGPTLFGSIRSVAMDSQNHVYVLDASDHSIRRFDTAGEHIATAGRSGRGPGDLADPYSLWHDGARSLYVVDWLNGINQFETLGKQIAFRRRFAEGLGAMAVCKVRGQLIAAGFSEGRILHLLNSDGKVVRSFGDAFRPDTDAVVQKIANAGSVVLACDDMNGRVYVTQAAHGQVRAYNTAGQLLWKAELPGFLGSQVLRDRNGAVVTLFPKHKTEALLAIGPNHLVVQAHHKERRPAPTAVRSPNRPRAVEVDMGVLTFVLSSADGRIIAREYAGPFLMAEARGQVAGYDDDPFPRVFALPVTIISR